MSEQKQDTTNIVPIIVNVLLGIVVIGLLFGVWRMWEYVESLRTADTMDDSEVTETDEDQVPFTPPPREERIRTLEARMNEMDYSAVEQHRGKLSGELDARMQSQDVQVPSREERIAQMEQKMSGN